MANIAKSYALGPVEVEVLKAVDLNLAAGDFLSIMDSRETVEAAEAARDE